MTFLSWLFKRRKERWFPGMWIINGDRFIDGDKSYMCTMAVQLWDPADAQTLPHFHLETE